MDMEIGDTSAGFAVIHKPVFPPPGCGGAEPSERSGKRSAKPAIGHTGPQILILREKAKHLRDHQRLSASLFRREHLGAVPAVQCHRLFAKHRITAIQQADDYLFVKVRRNADVYKINRFLRQHPVKLGVAPKGSDRIGHIGLQIDFRRTVKGFLPDITGGNETNLSFFFKNPVSVFMRPGYAPKSDQCCV